MTDLREQELLDIIENLTQENAYLKATIKGLQKKVFGPRTERRPDSESMMPSLFNEAEVEADPKAKEPELETTVKEHKRKKKSQTTLKGLLESLPEDCIENIDIDLDENHKVCDVCGHELHPLGKFLVNTQVEIIPARLICKRYYQVSYECRECRKDGQSHIVKPVMPKPPIPHSFASPSAVAHVMMQKYGLAMPLNRQEREWKQLGMPLSRATLANWIIIASKEYLVPLCDYMRTILLKETCLHADETPVQVLNENGRKNTSKSYMWVFTSGQFDSLHNIRLFQYSPTRKGDNAENFLKGFTGYLHTDDYSGYNHVDGVTRCLCWAHARRKFVEVQTAGSDQLSTSLAARAIEFIGALFKIEGELSELT